MKKLLVVVAVLAVLAVVGVLLLAGNLGAVVRAAVERFGSDATRAPVTLREADVDLTGGRATLRGLVVGNPQGYKTPSAFDLGEITVAIDTDTVTKDVVVLREVTIRAPKVTYELGDGMKSNIAKIEENVGAYGREASGGASRPSKGGSASDAGGESGAQGRRFVIRDLRMTGGTVTLGAAVAKGGVTTVNIPDLHLRDVGSAQGGMSEAELTVAILDQLTSASIKAATVGRLEDAAKGLLEKAKGVLDGVLGR